jgi:asparagine synthase (glutamine-hydrolysing)
MCGLCGFIDPLSQTPDFQLRETALAMCNRIAYRGPNAQAAWTDQTHGVGLAHCRLSILDLSDAGKQPMVSASGRYVIAFNGEIYNFKEIVALLENERKSPAWRGHSDTEVLLAAFDAWGVESTLPRLNGMFAFVAWDMKTESLYAGRDRVGKKPLYFGWSEGVFLFGSELKALAAHPKFSTEINMSSLAFFVNHSYVPSPDSIFSSFRKLPQGCFFEMTGADLSRRSLPSVRSYWDPEIAFEKAHANPFRGSFSDACSQLESLILDSVRLRMVADVPLGAFLSGGIDSALVAAVMHDTGTGPVKTFTIAFPGEPFDESGSAALVARHLNTEHTEIPVTVSDALGVAPRLAEIYDEPFADDSQIPTWLVCKHSSRHVTVALSGDGGDELFAGYESYRRVMRRWPALSAIPPFARKTIAATLSAYANSIGGHSVSSQHRAVSALRQSRKLACIPFEDYYQWFMSYNRTGANLFVSPQTLASSAFGKHRRFGLLDNMRLTDFRTFLTDDVCTKVDRASMNVSLEVRCPLLDYRIVDFAWSLPPRLLTLPTEGKLLLRSLAYKHVSRELLDRPKASFGIPISSWLRTGLFGWAGDLLEEGRIRRQGIFDPAAVSLLWRQHQSGAFDWGRLLWNLLMFESWANLNLRG